MRLLIESELRNFKLKDDLKLIQYLWKRYQVYAKEKSFHGPFINVHFTSEMSRYLRNENVDRPLVDLFELIIKKSKILGSRPVYIHVVYTNWTFYNKKRRRWNVWEDIEYVFAPKEVITQGDYRQIKFNKRLRYVGYVEAKRQTEKYENKEPDDMVPKDEFEVLMTVQLQ